MARKLKCYFLVMVYSALFNNVIEALNLLLINFYTYAAEIQLPGYGISGSRLMGPPGENLILGSDPAVLSSPSLNASDTIALRT
jgi:hypothetical protein